MTAWEPGPFLKLMGIRVLIRTAQRSEAELVVREELTNRRGVMHGGAIMGWGDIMGGMTTVAALPEGHRTATIESKTNFFAPIPKGDTARAVTTPLHIGRSTIVMQTNITRRRRQARRDRDTDADRAAAQTNRGRMKRPARRK
jgi:1,4-dihydroxy-2-naphthoyl-CoA hydrolase